ncbi:hypothetical protein FS749_013971 [Ceratobasidium sp. UAMH 11750]|nr:hypothetical protein FS749_013971 [Ceratobasidium sp. UAMH 11750]
MEADEGFYQEFLAFRARQQDQRRSNLSEAAPVNQTAVPAVPPLGAHPTPCALETMTSVGGAYSGMLLLHPAALLAYPMEPHVAIRSARLGVPRLSPYTRVVNLWPLHSLIQRRHLCHGQTITGLPPALPVIPRHPTATTLRLATRLPLIAVIQLPHAAHPSPLLTIIPQLSAVPPQHLIAVVLPPLVSLPHLVGLPPLGMNTHPIALLLRVERSPSALPSRRRDKIPDKQTSPDDEPADPDAVEYDTCPTSYEVRFGSGGKRLRGGRKKDAQGKVQYTYLEKLITCKHKHEYIKRHPHPFGKKRYMYYNPCLEPSPFLVIAYLHL